MIEDLEERKRLANAEWKELLNWSVAEAQKVSERLNREGAIIGLDTNREAYAYIHETRQRRLIEIAEKYGLPHKLKR